MLLVSLNNFNVRTIALLSLSLFRILFVVVLCRDDTSFFLSLLCYYIRDDKRCRDVVQNRRQSVSFFSHTCVHAIFMKKKAEIFASLN